MFYYITRAVTIAFIALRDAVVVVKSAKTIL